MKLASTLIPIIGYCDKLSGRPGDAISFMVSSVGEQPFDVQLVRVISADPNPEGPGIIEDRIESSINGSYPSREQVFHPGSYGKVDGNIDLPGDGSLSLSATIFPTRPGHTEQAILSTSDASLFIDAEGCLSARLGADRISIDRSLKASIWYEVTVAYDARAGVLALSQQPLGNSYNTVYEAQASINVEQVELRKLSFITIAASRNGDRVRQYFNGRIESPGIYGDQQNLLAGWDFSRGISSTRIEDTGPQALHGKLINLPMRGVTGSNWNAEEMCWRHASEQYAAIHFHDDDIYDFDWQSDFTFEIPDDLPSGIYAARISCGDSEDAIPFFVCPPKGKRSADLCVLVSTFTYVIYGNHARVDFSPEWHERSKDWNAYPLNPAEHRQYGLSTYNLHSDGSGICHASHRRPLFNLRPGFLTFSVSNGSGLRHLQADSHLIAWLHTKEFDYDIVTDQELHDDGVDSISGYKAVTTGSHPEYHTGQSLDALQNYRDQGGRFLYLGGNGFYWRIATHEEKNGALEIRRGEGGIRAWASEPGEYYNAFDGSYGGLWRRSARPPQQLAGIGFSAQGEFHGSPYQRKTGTDAPASAQWVFDGIDDEFIGDFGLSGGGAAGFELDRVDHRLGSADDIQILASSHGHDASFIMVPEEQLTHVTNLVGEPMEQVVRADMVYFETPSGGEVFATGSITFCGSLPSNNFDNNISQVLQNVMVRFLR